MVTNKHTFKGIKAEFVPQIMRFFGSAQVCSTIFKSCTTTVNGKVVRSQDDVLKSHREMEMMVVFAGITALHLNTEHQTFTLEITVIQEMEITDWKATDYGKKMGYADADGSHTYTIGCPKELIDQIHKLLEIYGNEEVIR